MTQRKKNSGWEADGGGEKKKNGKNRKEKKKDAHKEKREIMKLENARGNIDDCLT